MKEDYDRMQAFCREGDDLAREQEWRKAIQQYNAAASLLENGGMNPTYDAVKELLSSIYYNRGNAYAALRTDDAAISDYQRCLKDFQVLYNCGNSHFRLGQFESAKSCFEESYQIRSNKYALNAIRNCNIMLGNFDQIPQPDDDEQINNLLNYLSGSREIRTHTQSIAHTWKLNVLVDNAIAKRIFILRGNSGNVGNIPSGWVSGTGGAGYRGSPPISICVQNNKDIEDINETHSQQKEEVICFMAMEFGNDQLDIVLAEHIKPVLQQNFGIAVKTSRDIGRAGLIDDIIREGILHSILVIADLTHSNNGAYWESGYAEGCGIPVIYTCEERTFNNNGTHFDTSHLTTIRWSFDRLEDFESDLIQTVKNTLDALYSN